MKLGMVGGVLACIVFTSACSDRNPSLTPTADAASIAADSTPTASVATPRPTEVPSPFANTQPVAWAQCAPMLTPRSRPTATQLTDGRVLVIGGSDASEGELFSPNTANWSGVPGPTVLRREHSAQRLRDGRVIVFGGLNAGTRTEIFDPKTNGWNLGPDLPRRFTPSSESFALRDGRVLAFGGPLLTQGPAQLFVLDAAATRWTDLGTVGESTLGDAVLLSDGTILATNHEQSSVTYLLYDYELQSILARGPMPGPVSLATLQGSKAVAVGNDGSTDLFDVRTRAWAKGPIMPNVRFRPALVSTGSAVVAIGSRVPADAATAAAVTSFDGHSWKVLTPLNSNRTDETVITLADGRILVIGGRTGQQSLQTCELSRS